MTKTCFGCWKVYEASKSIRKYHSMSCYAVNGNFERGNYFAKGKSLPESHRLRLSEIAKTRTSENSSRWIKDRSKLAKRQERNDSAYKGWRTSVYRRDKKCVFADDSCFGHKIAHHIYQWAKYPKKRYDVSNGVILCQRHNPRSRVAEDVIREHLLQTVMRVTT